MTHTLRQELTELGERYVVETPVEAHAPDLYRYDDYAHSLETLDSIGKEQIEFFHQQGYLAIRRAFGHRDIAAARQAIWDLIDGKQADFGGLQVEAKVGESYQGLSPEARRNAVRKLFEFVDCDSRLLALAENSAVLQILTRILGERPVLFQDMALMKPPRVGREKPWHQDCAYFNLPVQATVVGIWIALDNATPENGCLHIIPRSHLEGPRPHFKKRDWQICDTDVPVHRRRHGSSPDRWLPHLARSDLPWKPSESFGNASASPAIPLQRCKCRRDNRRGTACRLRGRRPRYRMLKSRAGCGFSS